MDSIAFQVTKDHHYRPYFTNYEILSLPLTLEVETSSLLFAGAQTKTAMAIMNCIQARDSCMNNTACHPILEVVPRVCGAEKGEYLMVVSKS